MRYVARFNIEELAWEVFDTETQTVYESFSCKQDDELRHYSECRAIAHATRLNKELDTLDIPQSKHVDCDCMECRPWTT